MKAGLQEPLKGMGTAFSSSLFGLGGSLVLGFLDIQANHAQNRFFNELEEWLSGVTQLVDRTTITAPENPIVPTATKPDQKQIRGLAPGIAPNKYDLLQANFKENPLKSSTTIPDQDESQ